MESGILDKNGKPVFLGDTLVFPCETDENIEEFRAVVLFKYGCFGYETPSQFIPLIEWMKKEIGNYVQNYGNKIVYTNKYPFWIAPH